MTILSPTNLEKFDYGMPYWMHIYNRNIDLLNQHLLKVHGLGEVRQRYMQDGTILVWNEAAGEWQGKFFAKKLGDGSSCKWNDEFDSLDGSKWNTLSGSPSVAGGRLVLANPGGTDQTLESTYFLDDDFEVMVWFEAPSVATNSWMQALQFYMDATHYFQISYEYVSGAYRLYFRYETGAGEVTGYITPTKRRGLMRLSRINNYYSAWYKEWKDPQWSVITNRYLVSDIVPGHIRLFMATADTNPAVTGYIDRLVVARHCSSILTTTTTT